MSLPHKEGFTYCYFGSNNTAGWPGYSFFSSNRDLGFFIGTTQSSIQTYNPVGEWSWSYYHSFPDYPLTTPSNIVVMQDIHWPGGYWDADLFYGGQLYIVGDKVNSSFTYPINAVEYMHEPLHPNGEPYTENQENTATNYRLYPRWKDKDPYDWWNTAVPSPSFGYYSLYNPKVSTFIYNSLGVVDATFSIKKTSAYNGLSKVYNLDTDEYSYVQFNPANSSISATAKVALKFKSRLCCFNDGARIQGKVIMKKVSITLTPVTESYGYAGFNITYGGEPVEHSAVDFDFTINSDNATTADVKIQDIEIPAVDGYAVFIDDFYITSVTKP